MSDCAALSRVQHPSLGRPVICTPSIRSLQIQPHENTTALPPHLATSFHHMQLTTPGRGSPVPLRRLLAHGARFGYSWRKKPARIPQLAAICAPEPLCTTLPSSEYVDVKFGSVASPLEVIAVGLNVKNAPALDSLNDFASFALYQELDNSLYLSEEAWPTAIKDLCSCPEVLEAAVLLTCQRKEVYIVSRHWHTAVEHVVKWLASTSDWKQEDLLPLLVVLRGRDATEHLMRVAGGLESLVLGEGRILAEVKHAWMVSQGQNGFGPVLSALFRQSVTLGKRVRTETAIGTGSMSIAAAAVEKAKRMLPRGRCLEDACVCIVGAGRMATLIARHLLAKGLRPKRLIVVNRTPHRARQLEMQFPEVAFEMYRLSQLSAAVESSDVTFFAVTTEQPLLHRADFARMDKSTVRMRRLIDVSLPPAVDPSVKGLKGLALHDDTDLLELVVATRAERQAASREAEGLVVEAIAAFDAWVLLQEAVPTIKALRKRAEDIRSAAMAVALQQLDGQLTPRQVAVVEEMSESLISKLLHGPLAALRQDKAPGKQPLRRSMEELFELGHPTE